MKIKVILNDKLAKAPTKAHETDAGYDVYSIENVVIEAGESAVVNTGIILDTPKGMWVKIEDRSSMAIRGLKTAGGVIDSGYLGDIKIILWNLSKLPQTINKGDKIAQFIPHATYNNGIDVADGSNVFVLNTNRGTNGFGSSGK